MSFFKRAHKPEPISMDFPLIQDWEIVTEMSGGVTATLRGHVAGDVAGEHAAEWVRYVHAIVGGLRDEGFPSELALIRSVREIA